MFRVSDTLQLYQRLPFAPHRMSQSEPESLSQLDVCVFLLLTSISARQRLAEHSLGGRLASADLTPSLCTDEQQTWWASVHNACTNPALSSR